MQIEYEATFPNIDKAQIREKLKLARAELVRPEFLQKRVVFGLPVGREIKGGWLRVRDEGDKITMSLKVVDGKNIENQKEVCLNVGNFKLAVELLESIGCKRKAYQETLRELWNFDGVEVCIDEWPFLDPLVEIEGGSQESVKSAAEKLGFHWNDALFCSADTIYRMKYKLPEDVFNTQIPRIVFNMENPFLDYGGGN